MLGCHVLTARMGLLWVSLCSTNQGLRFRPCSRACPRLPPLSRKLWSESSEHLQQNRLLERSIQMVMGRNSFRGIAGITFVPCAICGSSNYNVRMQSCISGSNFLFTLAGQPSTFCSR